MNIVILDGFTMNPGDFSWDEWKKAASSFAVYPRTAPEQVLSRAAEADILLTNKTVITGEHIAALPRLKYIGVLATGYNVVDVASAKAKGIVVTNVPAYSTASVAQLVFAYILHFSQRVALHSQEVLKGKWCSCPDFAFTAAPIFEIAGKTLGIVGFGRIGRSVANIAHAFSMNVMAYVRRMPEDKPEWLEIVGKDEVFSNSDFLSLHCPLTEETRGIVNADTLAMMKKTAFLINTGRGQLVEEAALVDALRKQRIAGAALDVLAAEPPPHASPLLEEQRREAGEHLIITPHFAWATREARERLFYVALNNVLSFISGSPVNVV